MLEQEVNEANQLECIEESKRDIVEEDLPAEIQQECLSATLEDLEEEKITTEIPSMNFDKTLNEEVLLSYLDLPRSKQLKFTNPIRDYRHILANRIVHQIIKVQELIDDKLFETQKPPPVLLQRRGKTANKSKKESKKHPQDVSIANHEAQISKLKDSLKTLLKLHEDHQTYIKEQETVRATGCGAGDANMRKAEREIAQMSLAFDMMEREELQRQKFLVVPTKQSGWMKLWHPVIKEQDVRIPRGEPQPELYSEIEFDTQVESLVPLQFRIL